MTIAQIDNKYLIPESQLTSMYLIYHLSFFSVSQNLQKLGKYLTLIPCFNHFLQFKKILIATDTRYNFC